MDLFIRNRDLWDPGLLGDPVRHKGLYREVILLDK